jgi:microcystin-dependent protein
MAGPPYIGEVRAFAFGFAPKGWQLCNGQTLAINQNTALFSILGTTYGGNGVSTFQLPNLQGVVPISMGTDPFGNTYVEGETGGEVNHTLSFNEMPTHTHTPLAGATANKNVPAGLLPGNNPSQNFYIAGAPNTTLNPAAVQPVGGNQPHNNMAPYLVLNYCIAIIGIFPSRN